MADPTLPVDESECAKLNVYTSFSVRARFLSMHLETIRATRSVSKMAPMTAPTAMKTTFCGALATSTYGFVVYEPSASDGGTVMAYEYTIEVVESVGIASLEDAKEVILESGSVVE